MKRIFVAASYKNKEETNTLCNVIEKTNNEVYCFARDEGAFSTPQEMMQKAKEEIEKSQVFVTDISGVHQGRLIEAGIAYSMNKQIVFIVKKGTLVKDTVGGIANNVIEYDDIEDIRVPMEKILNEDNCSTCF